MQASPDLERLLAFIEQLPAIKLPADDAQQWKVDLE
jgi:hypothetical protein